MELRQLQYFTCLYEKGSVTRAALHLNVVQPAISMQIAKLEEELGQQLFERTPKGMVSTEAGHVAYRLFMPIVRDIFEAREQIRDSAGKVTGRISFGVIESVGQGVLVECLAPFTGQYPDVHISVTFGYTVNLLDSVRAGLLDFALINRTRGRIDLPVIDMLDEEMVVVSGINTAALPHTPATLHDVLKAKLVLPSRRHGLRSVIDQAAESVGLDVAPRLEIDELQVIINLVEQSDWITILPMIAVRSRMKYKMLRTCRIVTPRISRHVMCAYNPRRPLAPAARLFVEAMTANLSAVAELALSEA
jgi:LysR family transcriptional regulator, nitrogen assimilation regulatory protein